MTYCKLWDGLMRKDMDAIRIHCLSLNAGDLYPLLACMISARTWNSIERGITKASRSNTEVRKRGREREGEREGEGEGGRREREGEEKGREGQKRKRGREGRGREGGERELKERN